MKPAVAFAVRHSIRLQDFIECAKAAYVDVVQRELQNKKIKANVSRISVACGVHRRDVMRLQEEGLETEGERDLITKIVGQWRGDKRFTTKKGKPKVLSIGGPESEFAQLVASVSQDLNPGTVFFELTRTNAVSVSRDGATLLIESYVPKGDPLAGFQILAKDGEDLVEAVEGNVFLDEELPNFHARTEYDNIRPEAVDRIRRWLLVQGHEFHEKIRNFMSKYDQDVNPDPKFKKKGARIVFSSFSMTELTEKERDNIK